jgi:hypothetical protein
MNTNRSKTQKRIASVDDLSGNAFAAHLRASTNTFVSFLNQEADDAYKRPWHKLERGLRMNRLKKFVDDETTRLNLSERSKLALLGTLMKAFEKKSLNSKSAVIYDQDEQSIKEIKGLVMHRNAEGEVLFQLLEKRNAVTFRKKAGTVAPAPSAEAQPPKQ